MEANRTRIRNKREMPAGEFYGLTLDASFEYDYEYEDGGVAAGGSTRLPCSVLSTSRLNLSRFGH